MDPVSLVLGIAPLIISAVESYEATFQAFVTFHRYSREIDKFRIRLGAQKAIFHNQCQLLLLAAKNKDYQEDVLLDNILKDATHASRDNEALNQRLEDLLGSSATTCVNILRLIRDSLEEITKETKIFERLGEENNRLMPLPVRHKDIEKSSIARFRSRVKITLSKTRLNDIVSNLRLYNEDLVTLSRQMPALAAEKKSRRPPQNPVIRDLHITRQASEKLHSLLSNRWVCRSQVDHSAILSLEVGGAQHCRTGATVRFNLSLTCISENVPSGSNAIWLNVESIPKNEANNLSAEPADQSSEFSPDLTKTLEGLGAVGRKYSALEGAAGSLSPTLAIRTHINPSAALSEITSLSAIEGLCAYFHAQVEQSAAQRDPQIFLEMSNTFQHFVYRCECPRGCMDRTRSLKRILQESADERRREAWAVKFSLARLLTLAVLRFRSTPWLKNSLNSDDIHFLQNTVNVGNQSLATQPPCLQIRLSKLKEQRQATLDREELILPRNQVLFNLGIILLELGYDAPFQYLRQAEDIREGDATANWYTDFFTAKRLGKSAARQLDNRYGKIVKKCLDCDFGVGDDLDSVELQNAIVVEIVNELEKCIQCDSRGNSVLGL